MWLYLKKEKEIPMWLYLKKEKEIPMWLYLKKEKEIPMWLCPGFWPCLTQDFQKHTHKNVLPFSFFFFVYSLYEITDAL